MDANLNFNPNAAVYAGLSTIGVTTGTAARLEKSDHGAWLHVERGSVWLTQENCTEDVILGPGARYFIKRNGLTLMTNLGRQLALVTIEPVEAQPGTPSRAERFWKFWAALYAPQSRPTTAAL